MEIAGSKEACTGCFACMQLCPKQAINVSEDENGFTYPAIAPDLCIQCGLCQAVCPANAETLQRPIRIYSARHRSMEVLRSSQSGGIFYGVAQMFLRQGGVCYGAAYHADMNVRQTRIDTEEELPRLQGSKYVQSDPADSFLLTAKDLHLGRPVFYSGTSCIIAGLLSYLKQRHIPTDKLFTCDLICHGVPGSRFWSDYKTHLEKQNDSRLVDYKMRDKAFGWHILMSTAVFEDHHTVQTRSFLELYLSYLFLRPNCYVCSYADWTAKPADLTIGDFWGIAAYPESKIPDDDHGCSLAIVHTQKGQRLLDANVFEMEEISQETAMRKNRSIVLKVPHQRTQALRDYRLHGIEYCMRKYTGYGGLLAKARRKILKKLDRW